MNIKIKKVIAKEGLVVIIFIVITLIIYWTGTQTQIPHDPEYYYNQKLGKCYYYGGYDDLMTMFQTIIDAYTNKDIMPSCKLESIPTVLMKFVMAKESLGLISELLSRQYLKNLV